MTEKRFTFADGFNIVAIRDNGKIMNSKQVCEKLNELYEDNLKIEKENRTLKLLVQEWERLDDEKDEQLEKMNDSLKRLVEKNNELKIKNDLLSDELEQAKAVIHKKWDEYLKKKECFE